MKKISILLQTYRKKNSQKNLCKTSHTVAFLKLCAVVDYTHIFFAKSVCKASLTVAFFKLCAMTSYITHAYFCKKNVCNASYILTFSELCAMIGYITHIIFVKTVRKASHTGLRLWNVCNDMLHPARIFNNVCNASYTVPFLKPRAMIDYITDIIFCKNCLQSIAHTVAFLKPCVMIGYIVHIFSEKSCARHRT